MFFHVFKYRLKILLKDKLAMFWTLVFPILLSTLFFMAFGQLGAAEILEPIDTAIVDTANDQAFIRIVQELSKGEKQLLNAEVTSMDEALELLSSGKVRGIIETGDPLSLIVSQSGLSQSILKTFIDGYASTVSTLTQIAQQNPQAIENTLALLEKEMNFLTELPITRNNPDTFVIYFYSMLAMTCIFGSFLGANEINAIQADLTYHAARLNFAPVHKLKMFLSGATAAFLVQFTKLLIVLSYLVFVLSIDFGDRILLILLSIFICTFLGISLGAFITSIVRGSEGLKSGILIATGNIGALLAGMMQADIKYYIDTHVPIISRINPASLVTDAFFSLYFFDTYDRYILNILSIIVLCVIFSGATYVVIRRKKYVSI